MKRKRKNVASKNHGRGFKYHIKHKSKLTSLLIIKVLLMLLSFGVGIFFYLLFDGVLGQIISAIISFAIACMLYLSLIVKALKMLKF